MRNEEFHRNPLPTIEVRVLRVGGTACGGGAWHPLGESDWKRSANGGWAKLATQ